MKQYINFSKIIFYSILSLSAVFSSSCSKKLDLPSSNVASEEIQWTSISDTRSSLLGIYGLMRAALFDNNAHVIYGDLRSSDFISNKRSDLNAVISNDLNASYPIITDLSNWRRFYAAINAASIFIERAPEVLIKDKRYTEINLKYDIAQARALRAFAYFYICRIWGDVPLLTRSFDDGNFQKFKREKQSAVLNFATQELLKASEDLPYLYGVNPQSYYGLYTLQWQNVLFNKLSAYAILAHIAAWQGKYVDTDVYTKFILDNYTKLGLSYSSISRLTAASNGLFNSSVSNPQLIAFVAPYLFNESSATGHIEQLTLASPLINRALPDIYIPKDSIIKIFPSQSDTRFGIDSISGLTRTNYFTNFSGEIPIFSKIKILRDGTGDNDFAIYGSSVLFSRLEDITLLAAEAKAAIGERIAAMNLLNTVLILRGLKTYNVKTQTNILDDIFAERRRELMGEGCRWYDQVRWNKLRPVNPKIVKLIESDGIYWPISTEVIRNNKLIEQNAYWK